MAVRWLPLEANGDAAVKACAKLPAHPTLPKIHQTGHVGGSAFVAMEFPEGQLLSTMLHERLDLDLVLRIGAQLSDALATVHAQGVVHGELSADSVLLVAPDRAWLWDMPLVIANRLTDRRGESRLMQNLPRTAPYLAPERACGSESSREGDVYSLGALLCIASGAPMPSAPTTLGMVNLVATGAWECRAPSTIPDPWRAMLVRMVKADPRERPTAAEVAAVFSGTPRTSPLPTVPEFPAVRLPPELMAAAEQAVRRPLHDDVQARPTLEMPMVVPLEARRPMMDVATGRETPMPLPAVLRAAAEPTPAPAVTAPLPVVEKAAAEAPTPVTPVTSVTPLPPVAAADVPVVAPVLDKAAADDVVEVSQADVLRLPTLEIPMPAVAAAPAVALTHSVSVAPELVAAGARAVTFELPAAAPVAPVKHTSAVVMALTLLAAIAGLTVVAVLLMTRPATVVPVTVPAKPTPALVAPVAPAPTVEAVRAAPAPAPVRDEEELAPPPEKAAPRAAAPASRFAPRARTQSPRTPSAVAPAPHAEADVRPAAGQDFSFLEQAPAAAEPAPEPLKRPSL